MRISVIAPVKNEAQFIGYSVLSVLPWVHEFVYACAKSTDGTDEVLDYLKEKHAHEKLTILRKPEYDFNVHDMSAYNRAFNDCIEKASGDAVWFLHPDMIVTNPDQIGKLASGPLAWYSHVTSYARDFSTVITKGRATKWKHIHAKRLGLHYYGGYGSQNEDFYHADITGDAYDHYGEAFDRYTYDVGDSGIRLNHYCELKPYKRRFEKMKACLKTLSPNSPEEHLNDLAAQHPRVTLENTTRNFGTFEFTEGAGEFPPVFAKYKRELEEVARWQIA